MAQGHVGNFFQQGRVTEHVITYVNYWMLTANVHITSQCQGLILPQKSHVVKQICLLENESIITTEALTKPETRLQFIYHISKQSFHKLTPSTNAQRKNKKAHTTDSSSSSSRTNRLIG